MKRDKNNIFIAKGLRTGLFVVCFLAVMCAASGCGNEDKLLSELRKDSAADGESAEGGAAAGEESGGEKPEDTGEGSGMGGPAAAGGSFGAGEDFGGGGSAALKEESGAEKGEASKAKDREETGDIYVHVCGAVKRPGVYALPPGSRFYEAVDAAGGFAEDACEDYLNMAAVLADGSRLEIPTTAEIAKREADKAESVPGGGGRQPAEYGYYTQAQEQSASYGDTGSKNAADGAGAPDGVSGLVNINTADIEELCKLPGVGEGRAKAIVEYRQKQGGFQKKEDIMQVSGIGEKMYARMEVYLTVE